MASKNNMYRLFCCGSPPELSDTESDQGGKILETHIDCTKLTGEEKFLIRCGENAEITINDPPKLNIKTPGYSVIESPCGYKNNYVLPPFPIRDEDTVDEADIEEDDSDSDDKTDTNKPDHLDLVDDEKYDADDELEQENME